MRRSLLLIVAAVVALTAIGARTINHRPFPADTTPAGAYLRIVLAVNEGRVRDAFPYLETEAQWAAYTIRDARKKACDRVRSSYPPDQQKTLLDGWRDESDAPDGADIVALLGARRGWIARLERDLSGVASVDVQGERATVVTGREPDTPSASARTASGDSRCSPPSSRPRPNARRATSRSSSRRRATTTTRAPRPADASRARQRRF